MILNTRYTECLILKMHVTTYSHAQVLMTYNTASSLQLCSPEKQGTPLESLSHFQYNVIIATAAAHFQCAFFF